MKVRNSIIIVLSILMVFIFAGCEQQAKVGVKAKKAVKLKNADLVLKFAPGQVTKYKSTIEYRKDYSFVQPSLDKTTEKLTLSRTEIVFTQQIAEVDPSGNAVADITVDGMKCLSQDPQQGTMLDFDSTRVADATQPLASAIGKTYKIKLSPTGKVLEVLDAKAIRGASTDKYTTDIFSRLFGDTNIRNIHEILALPDAGKSHVAVGDSWSRIKFSPRGMLQTKKYEKIYKLGRIEMVNGRNIAIVDMNAIPTSKIPAEKLEAEDDQSMGVFANIFTSSDTYIGQLALDVDNGNVDAYFEKLHSVWVAAETEEQQKSDKGPEVLTIGFVWMHSIEAVGGPETGSLISIPSFTQKSSDLKVEPAVLTNGQVPDATVYKGNIKDEKEAVDLSSSKVELEEGAPLLRAVVHLTINGQPRRALINLDGYGAFISQPSPEFVEKQTGQKLPPDAIAKMKNSVTDPIFRVLMSPSQPWHIYKGVKTNRGREGSWVYIYPADGPMTKEELTLPLTDIKVTSEGKIAVMKFSATERTLVFYVPERV
jgi:hypothetical protein